MSEVSDPTSSGEHPRVVSVLVPLYNHAKTVSHSLDSILLSDTTKIELIVCDDASKDQSFEVARSWVEEHGSRFVSAVALKNAGNLGITGNLNRLMQLARGEFVTLLASDDVLTVGAIDMQCEFLQTHLACDFVFANCGTIDEVGRVLQPALFSTRKARVLKRQACATVDLVLEWNVPWSRLFARRRAFLAFGGYRSEHLVEDRWSALAIARTRRFAFMDVTAHMYRVRATGTGTAGLASQRLQADLLDIEMRATRDARGLLRALLFVRTKAFAAQQSGSWCGLGWRVMQRAMVWGHRLLGAR